MSWSWDSGCGREKRSMRLAMKKGRQRRSRASGQVSAGKETCSREDGGRVAATSYSAWARKKSASWSYCSGHGDALYGAITKHGGKWYGRSCQRYLRVRSATDGVAVQTWDGGFSVPRSASKADL